MWQILGRVEREFFLELLCLNRTPISIKKNGKELFVSNEQYTYKDNKLFFLNIDLSQEFGLVRLFFSNQNFKFYFDSVIKTKQSLPKEKVYYCVVSKDIYKSEQHSKIKGSFISFFYNKHYITLNYHQQKANVIIESSKKNQKMLLDRQKLKNQSIEIVDALFRYYESELNKQKTNINFSQYHNEEWGTLLFIDNAWVLLVLNNTVDLIKNTKMYCTVNLYSKGYNRKVELKTLVQNKIESFNLQNIYELSIIEIKQEDARFLYERVYKNKYQG